MNDDRPSNNPMEVVAVPGAVVVLGPPAGAVLTAHAAIQSAQRLLEAATRVMNGQVQRLKED